MHMSDEGRMLTVGPVAARPGEVLCFGKRKKMTFSAHVHAMHVQTVRFGVLQLARFGATAGAMRTGKHVMCSWVKQMSHLCQNAGCVCVQVQTVQWDARKTCDVQMLQTATANPWFGSCWAAGDATERSATTFSS
jgi:hypothetical protein